MRTFIAALAGVIAMVALVVALPAQWLESKVVDENGFVATAAPAGEDPQVRQLVSQEITRRVLELGTGAGVSLVEPLVAATATAYVASPSFRADFAMANRMGHQWLFAKRDQFGTSGDGQVGTAGTESWVIDVAPLLRTLAQQGIVIPAAGEVTIPLADLGLPDEQEPGRFHEFGNRVHDLSGISVAVTAIALAVSFLIARRRGLALILLGVGTIPAVVAGFVFAIIGSSYVNTELSGSDALSQRFSALVLDNAAANLHQWSLATLVVGGVMIVGGLVWLAVASVAGRAQRQQRY